MGPRVMLLTVFIIFLSIGRTFAGDRDPTESDLKGIPRSHKYAWAIAGGTALGAGIGIIAPGGTKSAFKGALLGGSLTSAFYLAKDHRAAYGKRSAAHIITNTVLGTSVGWIVCNCTEGAWGGALVGGGGTAIVQAFGTHRTGLARATGASSAAAQPLPDSPTNIVDYSVLAQEPSNSVEDKKNEKNGKPALRNLRQPNQDEQEPHEY